MNLIVAVDKKGGIGNNGRLLFNLPNDLKHFKEVTMGKTVVMGRSTYLSLPVKPLKGRRNIVLSKYLKDEGVEVYGSTIQLKHQLSKINSADLFVIGGESVYNLLSPFCEFAYVTEVDAEVEADTFFTLPDSFVLESRGEEQEENGFRYRFCLYKNTEVQRLAPLLSAQK